MLSLIVRSAYVYDRDMKVCRQSWLAVGLKWGSRNGSRRASLRSADYVRRRDKKGGDVTNA
jgi:hypothetical protein